VKKFVLRIVYSLRISWNVINGRWYSFRDAPDWLCCEYLAHVDDENPAMREIAAQAKNELELRMSKMIRDVRAAVGDNEFP
jgi:hypothetical protein